MFRGLTSRPDRRVPGEVDKLPPEPGVTLPVAEAIQKMNTLTPTGTSAIRDRGEGRGEGEALAKSQKGRE